MEHDPKMQIFFDEANRLLDTKRTFKDIFDIQIETWKKRTLFIYEDEKNRPHKVNYLQFGSFSKKYAYALEKKIDAPKGSFIALKMNNSPKWAYVFWGLLIAGYSPIMINPITLTSDTNRLIKESGAKAIINDKDEVLSVPNINVNSLELSEELNPEKFADKIAFCTSGTTGKSRIFVYNSENMVHQIYAAYIMPETTKTIMYQKPEVRLITIVPFSHIFGFVANLLWFTFFGRCFVFTKTINPDEISRMCRQYKVSHIFTVPLFWDRVAKSIRATLALESEGKQKLIAKTIAYNNGEISRTEAGLAGSKLVRNKLQKKILGNKVVYCIAGGSALSKDTLHLINGVGYPLYNGYGMTEIGITSVELSPNVIQRNKASVGKALYDVEYKIENGELLVKSPQIHSEILVDGKLEKAVLDKDGYFHTGDIASIDEEGYVYIKGKSKDIVIGANGENIYPDEIETKFSDIDLIDDLSVLGIPTKDGEKLALIIYISRRLEKEEIEKLENQIADANERLPVAMQVQEFYLSTSPLPTNTSMKVMRYQIIDDLKNRPEGFIKLSHGEIVSFEGFDEKDIKDISEHVIDIVSDVLGVDKKDIAPNSHVILDLGGDSFTYMSVIASIEAEFEIKIPTEMIGRLNTINEFTLYILKQKN